MSGVSVKKIDMNSDSKDSQDYEKAALDNLRISLAYFIGRLGLMGLVQVIREIIYMLQDEGYSGISTFLEGFKVYIGQEADKAPIDVQRTWRKVFWQISCIIQETLTKGRELP